jgi:hypothetical protein
VPRLQCAISRLHEVAHAQTIFRWRGRICRHTYRAISPTCHTAQAYKKPRGQNSLWNVNSRGIPAICSSKAAIASGAQHLQGIGLDCSCPKLKGFAVTVKGQYPFHQLFAISHFERTSRRRMGGALPSGLISLAETYDVSLFPCNNRLEAKLHSAYVLT